MTPAFRVLAGAELRTRNTFGVEAHAPVLLEVDDVEQLPEALSAHVPPDVPVMVLGGGSNLLLAGDPVVPLLSLRDQRMAILAQDDTSARVRAAAGANWHSFVSWTLDQDCYGLENLALIPGTVGAAPIQNIGAYGAEVGEFIHAVEAYEPASGRVHRFDNAGCRFGYRDSLFKHAPDRFLVTAVEFTLSRVATPRVAYAGIREELADMGINTPSPRQVADAVIRLRSRKLPDPAVIGNAGSFFKNPIVDAGTAAALSAEHPALPVFPAGDGQRRKLSAAWLIDACGWKGWRDGDAGVSERHALVLVNHGHATGLQLLALARRISTSVEQRFGVPLEPEPRIVGARW